MLGKFFPRKTKGFSLVELMVVVVIVAVLAAIAIPSYNDHVRKSRRGEAIAMVHSLMGRLERARSSLMSYASFDDYESSEFQYYTYKIDVADDGRSYTIQAIPTAIQSKE